MERRCTSYTRPRRPCPYSRTNVPSARIHRSTPGCAAPYPSQWQREPRPSASPHMLRHPVLVIQPLHSAPPERPSQSPLRLSARPKLPPARNCQSRTARTSTFALIKLSRRTLELGCQLSSWSREGENPPAGMPMTGHRKGRIIGTWSKQASRCSQEEGI